MNFRSVSFRARMLCTAFHELKAKSTALTLQAIVS